MLGPPSSGVESEPVDSAGMDTGVPATSSRHDDAASGGHQQGAETEQLGTGTAGAGQCAVPGSDVRTIGTARDRCGDVVGVVPGTIAIAIAVVVTVTVAGRDDHVCGLDRDHERAVGRATGVADGVGDGDVTGEVRRRGVPQLQRAGAGGAGGRIGGGADHLDRALPGP